VSAVMVSPELGIGSRTRRQTPPAVEALRSFPFGDPCHRVTALTSVLQRQCSESRFDAGARSVTYTPRRVQSPRRVYLACAPVLSDVEVLWAVLSDVEVL
jgi:hypothetical protein